jgi:hypothetical protein
MNAYWFQEWLKESQIDKEKLSVIERADFSALD